MDEFENKMHEPENEPIENTESEKAQEPEIEAQEPSEEQTRNENERSFDPFGDGEYTPPYEAPKTYGYDAYGRPYTPQEPPKTYYEPRPEKAKSKGLFVFCILLSVVLTVVLICCVGYIVSRKPKNSSEGDKHVTNSVPSVELYERPENDEELAVNYTDAMNSVVESVVDILVYSPTDDSLRGSASGVIYSEDGYIVTNDHIYESVPSAKFVVRLYDGTEHYASFVAGDVRSDLAVIKFDEEIEGLVPATFGDSNASVIGEPVITVGFPFTYGESATVTHGILSAVDRRVSSSTTNYASTFLQTDATINPGNSGGALCNMYGQVIGITSSKLAGDEYDAVTFAIPTSTMKMVVDGLIKDGCVADRAKLGITYTEIGFLTADALNMPRGVMIQSVSEDSDLSSFGFTKGDIITNVNGTEVLSSNTLLDVVDSSKAGDEVELTIYRASKGEEETVTIKMLSDEGVSSYTTKKQNNDYNIPFGF